MSIVVPRRAIGVVSAAIDPKQAILKEIGDLSDFKVYGDYVLLATYIRPEKTVGGIIRPDSNVEEDVWQGKVGLVVKLGTTAFRDTADYKFPEEDIPVLHEWVRYYISFTTAQTVNGYPCREIRDIHIRGTVPDPQMVF